MRENLSKYIFTFKRENHGVIYIKEFYQTKWYHRKTPLTSRPEVECPRKHLARSGTSRRDLRYRLAREKKAENRQNNKRQPAEPYGVIESRQRIEAQIARRQLKKIQCGN
jgi:hypothetical protein